MSGDDHFTVVSRAVAPTPPNSQIAPAVFGCDGNDTFDVTGWVAVRGGEGSDTVRVRTAGMPVDVQAGEGLDDIAVTGRMSGRSIILGGGDPDVVDLTGVSADSVRPFVLGGQGADRLTCGPAPCNLFGEDGYDTLLGGPAADLLVGGADGDTLDGGGGDDELYGNANRGSSLQGDLSKDDDTIRGGEGNDTIDGGPGTDRLYGDAGKDAIDGGAGWDSWNDPDGVTGPNLTTLANVERTI